MAFTWCLAQARQVLLGELLEFRLDLIDHQLLEKWSPGMGIYDKDPYPGAKCFLRIVLGLGCMSRIFWNGGTTLYKLSGFLLVLFQPNLKEEYLQNTIYRCVRSKTLY